MTTGNSPLHFRARLRSRHYGFASLLKIFNQPGLASVDLIDSFPRGAIASKQHDVAVDNVGPVPDSGRPAHTKFMPWRID